MKHTPTPWSIERRDDDTGFNVRSRDGYCLFGADDVDHYPVTDLKCAVSCVNICNGNPEAIKELIEAAEQLANSSTDKEQLVARMRIYKALANLKKESQ